MRTDDHHSPISAQDAKRLFADWKAAPAIVLAVSGGPDSIALMWLAARWRSTLARGPRLVAVTVDHGLRVEATGEARDVKRLARTLDLTHRTMRWAGDYTGQVVGEVALLSAYGRERPLSDAEQTALLDAATAYLNVLRDTASAPGWPGHSGTQSLRKRRAAH